MMRPTLLLALSTIFTATATGQQDDKVLRLFVFAGQSNMEGADAKAADIGNYPGFEGVEKPQSAVRYWYMLGRPEPKHNSGTWVALAPDHHGRFGPELTFARTISKSIKAPIAIIKSAWGGTTLAKDWDPDAPSEKKLFSRTLQLIQKARADLTRRGIKHRLEAFVWHQGENDMLNRDLMKGYGKRLQEFLARWRKELKAPQLKWLIGEISGKGIWGLDHRRNMQTVRKQQRDVTTADPLAWFVATSHLAFEVMGHGQPHYHFGTEGQLHHGVAYAQAYLSAMQTAPTATQQGSVSSYKKGQQVRVFIVAGQRSAEGDRCYVAQIPKRDRAILATKVPFHFRLAGGLHQGVSTLQPQTAHDRFGPELSLGKALHDANRGAKIAIIKVTHSAAMLADWLPNPSNASRPQYQGSIAFIRKALAAMSDQGAQPSLEAVFWIPGEHDCWWGSFRQRYAEDLTTLVTSMRKDLNSPKLKWLVAELPDNMRWGTEQLAQFDVQIGKVAAADPLLWFVPTNSIAIPKNSVTFGTQGTIKLGRLLAKHYLALQ
jgi:hypothetical protein